MQTARRRGVAGVGQRELQRSRSICPRDLDRGRECTWRPAAPGAAAEEGGAAPGRWTVGAAAAAGAGEVGTSIAGAAAGAGRYGSPLSRAPLSQPASGQSPMSRARRWCLGRGRRRCLARRATRPMASRYFGCAGRGRSSGGCLARRIARRTRAPRARPPEPAWLGAWRIDDVAAAPEVSLFS